jgi:PPOX class probable F420-dependent enzyme
MTIWLTTVGRDGTPQPNPVGFLWDGGGSLLTYSQTEARRLANIRRQPLVSLNFDSNGGGDVVVLTGTAEILDDYPAMPGDPAWLEKYGEAIDARFGSAVKFAERFSVPVRIHLTRVRGFLPTRHVARSRAVMNAPVTGSIVVVPAMLPSNAGTRLRRPQLRDARQLRDSDNPVI